MKQILQNLKSGQTNLADIPCPKVGRGELLIQSRASLISAGTERMLLKFGRAGMLDKARQQPEKVKQVLDKVRTDGLLPTLDAVRSKLDQPLPLGYCNVGVVIEIGSDVTGFEVGDRVASNGAHAEVVVVPQNLCAIIPDEVDDNNAVFTVIGAIGLQGVRLAKPTLGEVFVVIGLGLIGLVTVQLLRAQGCRVLGVDTDSSKVELARLLGAETADVSKGGDPLAIATAFSRGRGVDGVLITASTKSNQPVAQAAAMCRKRGRIVLVGVTGLALDRNDFFKKELSFQVSCSYGPGRYDPAYEQEGHDYPIGYVRWTEQRNFEAVLDMMASGAVDCRKLLSHRYPISKATSAYDLLASDERYLGILLEYDSENISLRESQVEITAPEKSLSTSDMDPVVSFIGAGNYAGRVLIPIFKKLGADLDSIVTSGGVSGAHYGKKYGFNSTATNTTRLFKDACCNVVVIATRHNTHASYVCEALRAGKHVFVEKPLALTHQEIDAIELAYQESRDNGTPPQLMVGFNRRFAPQVVKIKHLLDAVREPKSFIMTVNAGAIPAESWVQDIKAGGGRIIGEACHFVDLLRFLANSPVVNFQVNKIGAVPSIEIRDDKVSFTLSFEDGSLGTVHYFANGDKSFPKERLEIFCAGGVLQLDNFRRLRGYGWPSFNKMNLWRQDKGQSACIGAFLRAISTREPAPIPYAELVEVSRLSIDIAATPG